MPRLAEGIDMKKYKPVKKLLAVKASAGSGKTFRLANRYISLLNTDSPANIVAITFTNKAANEMKERIVKFLRELGSDRAVVDMICEELGIGEKELLERKEFLIEKFLTNDVNIQTIDSFINKILRKFSYFAGFGSDFDIGKENRGVVFSNFLRSLSQKEFFTLVQIAKNEEKFSTLTELFEKLYEIDKELKNVNFAPVSKPSDTAAKTAFLRLRNYINDCEKASASAKKAINIDFFDIPNQTWFAKEAMKEYSYFKKKGVYQEWFEDVLSALKDFFRDYFEYREYLFFKNLLYFYNRYKEEKWNYKKSENILDFKDIEHLVFYLLQEREIEKDFLYFRLDSRINHILMDEFQDTSLTQWKIFEPLVDEIASGNGRDENRSFFYVGDTKQAIYRFRGGSKELFDYVAKKYAKNSLKTEKLDTNYRSDKNIVEFVNTLFSLDEKAHSKEEGYVEVEDITKEDAFEKLYEKIEFLNKNKVADRDIAVLVFRNEDILNVGEFLKSRGKNVVTAKKAKVLSRPFAKAVVSLMKYIHNPKLKIEKLNFLSLTGKKWSDETVNIEIKKPVFMVKEIMEKFSLTDESTLKLLEHCRKYETLDDFVEYIDEYDEELPFKEFEGISVITIHKSKGLEFPHIIVMDRLSRENGSKSNLLFYYEDSLKSIKLKIKNRESVDEDYKKIKEKEALLVYEDKKNLEYVAFTRAEHSLIILKRSEKKKNGQSYSAFVSPLEKCAFGTVVPSEKQKDNTKEPKKVKIENYGVQDVPVKEEEYKPNDYRAIYFGDALHYAFECENIEAVRNVYGDFVKFYEVEEIYEKSKQKLEKGKKEVPFIFEKKTGRIDLLIEKEDTVMVIDYKSAKPKDERVYKEQVKEYMRAVEAFTGKKSEGYLFYTDIQEKRKVE